MRRVPSEDRAKPVVSASTIESYDALARSGRSGEDVAKLLNRTARAVLGVGV